MEGIGRHNLEAIFQRDKGVGGVGGVDDHLDAIRRVEQEFCAATTTTISLTHQQRFIFRDLRAWQTSSVFWEEVPAASADTSAETILILNSSQHYLTEDVRKIDKVTAPRVLPDISRGSPQLPEDRCSTPRIQGSEGRTHN